MNTLTYSFATSGSNYGNYPGDEPVIGFEPLNALQQEAVSKSLAMYSAVSGLTFNLVADTDSQYGELRFGKTGAENPGVAWASFPNHSNYSRGGDVWLRNSEDYFGQKLNTPLFGTGEFKTIMHEIGHALGLQHPLEGGMPADRRTAEYSVMSHSFDNYSPQSLMMYDIAAIQYLYGPNFNTNSGNTTYKWSPSTGQMSINSVGQDVPVSNLIFLTVWDGGGIDTYDFSNYATDLKVDLRPGEWTTVSTEQLAEVASPYLEPNHPAAGNIANALLYNGDLRSLIENAYGGSGNDTIRGNAAANMLVGGGGNDILYGGDGNDILVGESGNDVLQGEGGNDTYQFRIGYGHDIVLDQGNAVDVDTLQLIDLDVQDVLIASTGASENDLTFTLRATGESLTVQGQFSQGGVERLSFFDSAKNMSTYTLGIIQGTAGSDTLNGTTGNDLIISLGGTTQFTEKRVTTSSWAVPGLIISMVAKVTTPCMAAAVADGFTAKTVTTS